jgi:DNA replication protein DnaC
MKKQLDFRHIETPRYWREITIVPDVPDDCPRCHGMRTVYAVTEWQRSEDGTQVGWGEYVPCPVCTGLCAVCGGKGTVTPSVPTSDPAFGKMQPCPANCAASQRLVSERQDGIMRYSRLPQEYQTLTFETFASLPGEKLQGKMAGYYASWLFATTEGCWVDKAIVAEQMGQTAASDSRNWLVLYGPVGTAKTGLAAAALRVLSERGIKARYIRLPDFIEAVQKRYSKRNEYGDEFGDVSSEDVLAEVKESPVLILDEFDVRSDGKTKDIAEDKLAIVEKLIRFRHGEKLPTLITTNLDQGGMKARWQERIFDVIKQRSHFVPVRGVNLRDSSGEWDWEQP